MTTTKQSRAQGCLLGQLAGDALGSLVEFQSPQDIKTRYPDGVRNMADGGTFNTIAGQPTDDSEMALLLARMLVKNGTYSADAALKEYKFWLDSEPFDCGHTVLGALTGSPNPDSQANGAMMRISPLGIFGANFDLNQVAEWAIQDAGLTHPHIICQQANELFVMGISLAIQTGCTNQELYQQIYEWAKNRAVELLLLGRIELAAHQAAECYPHSQGWVLVAFQNALYQLLHAPSLEAGVVDSISRGGDTDTNAAICGAMLGAVYGADAVPTRWVETLSNCRADANSLNPRPECFWPTDALALADKLIAT